MNRHTTARGSAVILGLFLLGCAPAEPPTESITITQQTPGRVERFSKPEVDVAFRKQAREDARALRLEDDFDFCCVVFSSDVRVLTNVIEHFNEHVPQYDIEDYGLLFLENEDQYLVILWERYTVEGQYQVDGFWYPEVDNPHEIRHREYGYLIDRDTLEILEFSGDPGQTLKPEE